MDDLIKRQIALLREWPDDVPGKDALEIADTIERLTRRIAELEEEVTLFKEEFHIERECRRRIKTQLDALRNQDPIAWVRRHPDGALTAEFLEDAVIGPVRKKSGAWIPLYTQAKPGAAVPEGWKELMVSAISRMRAAHVPCNDLVGSAEAMLAVAPAPAQDPLE